MSEVKIIVDGMTLSYEGLFDAAELYKMIDQFFWEKGYDKREIQNMEKVEQTGKYIELELQPYKKLSDYAKVIIRIYIRMFDVKEVEVEKDGQQIRLNQGRLNLIFDGFLETDYEGRWESKPMYVFMRTVFDKFIYKTYTAKYESILTEEIHHLHSQIKSFLNLYRYTAPIEEKGWNA
ncbi:hypothetical protein KY320_01160 [Candidatus Woesearchaeota archaeon]|nr:hypothetical protein [Candidatus Woesearchaeota archaeon]